MVGIQPIDPKLSKEIGQKNLFVLRDSRTHIALNVSHTEEGLYWTGDPHGRLICFKNARLEKVYDKTTKALKSVKIVGDTRFSRKVYIEKFIPRDQLTRRGQIAEYTYTGKAFWLAVASR